MNPNDYQKLAIRTENTPRFLVFSDDDRRLERILHGLIGLSTEAGELCKALVSSFDDEDDVDQVNVLEEVGDLLWYLAITVDALGLQMEDLWKSASASPEYVEVFGPEHRLVNMDHETLHPFALGLSASSADALDLFKKRLFYNKPIDEARLRVLIECVAGEIGNLACNTGISLSVVMERNIAKLRARYPDKYSDELAESRDLEAERKALSEQGG